MTFPSIITDNFYKFCLTIGFGLWIYIVATIIPHIENLINQNSKLYYAVQLNVDLNNQLYVSAENDKHSLREILRLLNSNNLDSQQLGINKYKNEMPFRKKTDSISNLISENNKKLNEKLELDSSISYNQHLFWRFMIGSILLIAIGLKGVFGEFLSHPFQRKVSKENDEYVYCQSCGMEKKLDNYSSNRKFCSNCFCNNQFSHPEETMLTMQQRVRDIMVIKNFKDKEIKKHLKRIPELERWEKKFKW